MVMRAAPGWTSLTPLIPQLRHENRAVSGLLGKADKET
jgi:hypothetical protein